MLFPYLDMVHSCVPSELVSDKFLVLWTIRSRAHFLWQWQARGHHSSPQSSMLWGVHRGETRLPFFLTYNITLSKSWTMILPVQKLNNDTSSSLKHLTSPPKKKTMSLFYNVVQLLSSKTTASQASVAIGILFGLEINLSFLPWLNWKRSKSSCY